MSDTATSQTDTTSMPDTTSKASKKKNPPFHLAIPVSNLAEAEAFYGDILGCPRGRRSDTWIDFDFFGHQLVTHLSESVGLTATNDVEDKAVPVLHFGVVIDLDTWTHLATTLKAANVSFIIEPCLRHKDKPGEQHIFFVKDPSGNALEFKSLTRAEDLFAA